MKNIVVLTVLLAGLSSLNVATAQDDVYDAPVSRPAKVKSPKPVYSERSEQIISPEKTQAYTEEDPTTSRLNRNSYSQNDNRYNDNNYTDDLNYGYTDRIRRFHNSSFQFNYGWNNWYNNYYTPWNSYYSISSWDYYSFSPSWIYSYNNFYNPFCGTSVVFFQPGFSSWYNTGYCSPFSNWNYYNNWYGFSPYCANTIYSYGYYNYGGYYDYNKKHVIYAPRTGGYYNAGYSGRGNFNNNSTNTNNTGGFNNTTNPPTQQQAVPPKKWENRNNNNNYSNPNPDNVYKYNNLQPPNNNHNGGWNNSSRPEPNIHTNPGNSGVKIGTRPK